jgi:KDO2-lipid IV(A) lauroyltransferase
MGRSSLLRAFKNNVIYGGLVVASAVGRSLPLGLARAIGRGIGSLAYHVVPRERRKALRSLTVAFPDLDEVSRQRLARKAFRHLGESLLEIAWLPRLNSRNFTATTRVEGAENLKAALDAGHGVVLFTGHCGNWEWMAATIALAGFPMKVIARDIYDSRLNDFIVGMRRRFGVETIGRGSTASARDILGTLRGGAILGVLIDQSIRADSSPIQFFGTSAPTPIGPAQLAIRSGAMAIAGFIERRDGTQIVRFEPPHQTNRGDDPVELTMHMTNRIEDQIRRVPEQWVWMHDRWRER